ncbi:hypothetical protein EGW08_018511 [Elysia chlorotica]|uniref:Uncharacterized protein n=1 Tax=Elysia chlorotica TaxID=188477 RepID=A0A3S0ZB80_ELYCH|nr:hypothetical protein EGW08_018511 [Elysia chlorotica]
MIENFEKLIWKHSADLFLSKYDNSTKEMVAICAEGSEGWLLYSHMDWICQNLNCSQRKVLNAVCNFCDVESLRKLKERMEGNIERLNFVMNIGKDADGTVYMGSFNKSGNHWVLVSLD